MFNYIHKSFTGVLHVNKYTFDAPTILYVEIVNKIWLLSVKMSWNCFSVLLQIFMLHVGIEI